MKGYLDRTRFRNSSEADVSTLIPETVGLHPETLELKSGSLPISLLFPASFRLSDVKYADSSTFNPPLRLADEKPKSGAVGLWSKAPPPPFT